MYSALYLGRLIWDASSETLHFPPSAVFDTL